MSAVNGGRPNNIIIEEAGLLRTLAYTEEEMRAFLTSIPWLEVKEKKTTMELIEEIKI